MMSCILLMGGGTLERTNLSCFGILLQEGTLGERICLPWLRPFQNAKNP